MVMMMVMSNSMYAILLCMCCVNSRLGSHAAEQIHVTALCVSRNHILVCNKNPLLLCQRLHTMGAILALGTIDYVSCMNFHLSTYKQIQSVGVSHLCLLDCI